MKKETEDMPIYCTMRIDAEDEINLLCSFPDGQKYDAVSVHIANPKLAENIMGFINNFHRKSQDRTAALEALEFIIENYISTENDAPYLRDKIDIIESALKTPTPPAEARHEARKADNIPDEIWAYSIKWEDSYGAQMEDMQWRPFSPGPLPLDFALNGGEEGSFCERYVRAALQHQPEAVGDHLERCLDKVQDWLGSEIFDDDERDKEGVTQEERAENISDMIRDALAAKAEKTGGA